MKHAQIDVLADATIPDGDHDAILTRKVIALPETDYVIHHKLGRVPRQIQIVWKDQFCDFKVARDATGRPMMDSEKVVLNFSEANTTMTLRIA
ncbi:MAG TPA: hypothetical protein VK465_08715 [Fibrobacteria bacterium]|nr:hypothetical protein [Fibrobacteria bacterium]